MIISISGFKGSGKDTIADLISMYGYRKISMSSRLKDTVSTLFSLPRHLLEGDTLESREWRELPIPHLQWLCGSGIFRDDQVITPRLLLQRIGTDLFRNSVHNDFWVNTLSAPDEHLVISDTRFLNEREHVEGIFT